MRKVLTPMEQQKILIFLFEQMKDGNLNHGAILEALEHYHVARSTISGALQCLKKAGRILYILQLCDDHSTKKLYRKTILLVRKMRWKIL